MSTRVLVNTWSTLIQAVTDDERAVDWLVNVSGVPKGQGLAEALPFFCALAPGWLLQMKSRGPYFT